MDDESHTPAQPSSNGGRTVEGEAGDTPRDDGNQPVLPPESTSPRPRVRPLIVTSRPIPVSDTEGSDMSDEVPVPHPADHLGYLYSYQGNPYSGSMDGTSHFHLSTQTTQNMYAPYTPAAGIRAGQQAFQHPFTPHQAYQFQFQPHQAFQHQPPYQQAYQSQFQPHQAYQSQLPHQQAHQSQFQPHQAYQSQLPHQQAYQSQQAHQQAHQSRLPPQQAPPPQQAHPPQQVFRQQPFRPGPVQGTNQPMLQSQANTQNIGANRGSPSSSQQRCTPTRTDDSGRSALRGPPRKPKQSGYAVWIGNLPPNTNIVHLKDYFSRGAKHDIESVSLMSSSHSGFANYKSRASCFAAAGRFHETRFNGARLECRPRILPVSGNSSTASASKGNSPQAASPDIPERKNSVEAPEETKDLDKYFIMKSLTVEDLERSVHNGIWATQSQNEETLNNAFQTARNVWLIFSANGSGEFFGYARMDSGINDEAMAAADLPPLETEIPPQSQNVATAELPLIIPTPATSTAPPGYIVDDSARGTLFWEAAVTSSQAGSSAVDGNLVETENSERSEDENSVAEPAAPRSTPFRITWRSTARLPFRRTRGLRNEWNGNQEVKIARDGTRVEPGVGRRLVSMFNTGVVGPQPRSSRRRY